MNVEFRNVTKRYGKTTVVDKVNLTVKSGAIHFLLGPSGCGKTTILRMLAGLEQVSEGQILFDAGDVTRMPAADRGIGMVFQNYALWPHMTVLDNIEYGLKLRKLSKLDFCSRVDEVLQITQLTGFIDRLPGQLSGGQQQRVALARALAIRPNVLLLDEPLSNLDAKLRQEMRGNISRIHKKTRITTVYVTHDQKEALSMGSDISIMRSGVLLQTATPRDLYNTPESPFVAGFIGETNIIAGIYRRKAGESHLVDTKLGPLVARRKFGEFTPGSSVFVAIRPETVKLPSIGSKPDANCFEMTLRQLTYLGESEQLLFSEGETSIKLNLFDNLAHGLCEGSRPTVHIPAEAALILAPDELVGRGT